MTIIKIKYKSQPLKQNWDQELPKYWFDNSPFKTHFMNAMSIIVPVGEYSVIHAIRESQKDLKDLELKAQISEMIAQENWHSYSHKKYNQWLHKIGLPSHELSSKYLSDLLKVKKRVDKYIGETAWLPAMVGGEHNAAIFIEYFLERPRLVEQMHPHFKQAFVWHFIEELEHKGSCMDMWLDTQELHNRNRIRLGLAHFFASLRVNTAILRFTFALLKHDKQLWKWKTFKDGTKFLFGLDGLFFNTIGPWCRVFTPHFHPWNYDSSHLLTQYSKILETEVVVDPAKIKQIEEEFQGCVTDTDNVIRANNQQVHEI